MVNKLFEFWQSAQETIVVILFMFWAGITRTIFSYEKRTLTAYLISVFISIPAGTLAVAVFKEMQIPYYLSVAFGVTVGIVAHDLIEGLLLLFSDRKKISVWIAKKFGIGKD